VERRGEGLTTEDLAGRGAEERELTVEEADRSEGERASDESSPAREQEGREREPIVAGPSAETPIVLDEREAPEGRASERTAGPVPPAPPSDVAPERVDLGEPRREDADAVRASSAVGPLMADADRDEFVSRWREIQFRFVEKPRDAVEQADGLVAEVMQRLAQMFADERANLESQWSHGDEVSTEELRIAFQRYREFFDRLLET
jgi:hypothetical protein